MPGNPRDMYTMAERRFPVSICIGAPYEALRLRLTEMTAWINGNCGGNGWAMTRGCWSAYDAVSIHFADATLATAFVARCFVG
jgi:hypothetical protein